MNINRITPEVSINPVTHFPYTSYHIYGVWTPSKSSEEQEWKISKRLNDFLELNAAAKLQMPELVPLNSEALLQVKSLESKAEILIQFLCRLNEYSTHRMSLASLLWNFLELGPSKEEGPIVTGFSSLATSPNISGTSSPKRSSISTAVSDQSEISRIPSKLKVDFLNQKSEVIKSVVDVKSSNFNNIQNLFSKKLEENVVKTAVDVKSANFSDIQSLFNRPKSKGSYKFTPLDIATIDALVSGNKVSIPCDDSFKENLDEDDVKVDHPSSKLDTMLQTSEIKDISTESKQSQILISSEDSKEEICSDEVSNVCFISPISSRPRASTVEISRSRASTIDTSRSRASTIGSAVNLIRAKTTVSVSSSDLKVDTVSPTGRRIIGESPTSFVRERTSSFSHAKVVISPIASLTIPSSIVEEVSELSVNKNSTSTSREELIEEYEASFIKPSLNRAKTASTLSIKSLGTLDIHISAPVSPLISSDCSNSIKVRRQETLESFRHNLSGRRASLKNVISLVPTFGEEEENLVNKKEKPQFASIQDRIRSISDSFQKAETELKICEPTPTDRVPTHCRSSSIGIDASHRNSVVVKRKPAALPPIPAALEEIIMRKFSSHIRIPATSMSTSVIEDVPLNPVVASIKLATIPASPISPVAIKSFSENMTIQPLSTSYDVSYDWLQRLTSHFSGDSGTLKCDSYKKSPPKINSVAYKAGVELSRTTFSSFDFLCIFLGFLIKDVGDTAPMDQIARAMVSIQISHFAGLDTTDDISVIKNQKNIRERNSSNSIYATSDSNDVQLLLSSVLVLGDPTANHPWLSELIKILTMPRNSKLSAESRMIKLLFFVTNSLFNEKVLVAFECLCPAVCPSCIVRLLWPLHAFDSISFILESSFEISDLVARATIQSSCLALIYRLLTLRFQMPVCIRYDMLDIAPYNNSFYNFPEFCHIIISSSINLGFSAYNTIISIMCGNLNPNSCHNTTILDELTRIYSSQDFDSVDFFASKLLHTSLLPVVLESITRFPISKRVDILKGLNLFVLRGKENCELLLALPPGWRTSLFSVLSNVPWSPKDSTSREIVNYVGNFFVVLFFHTTIHWSNGYNVLEEFLTELIAFASWNKHAVKFVRFFLSALLQVLQKRANEFRNAVNSNALYNILLLMAIVYEFIFFSSSSELPDDSVDINDDELKFLPASPAFPNAREISLSRNLRSSVADKTTLNNSAIISSPPAYGLSPSAYGASKRNSALSSNSDIFQMHATNRRIDSGINHHARLLWQTTLNGIIEMRVDSNIPDLALLPLIFNMLKALGCDREFNESLYIDLSKSQSRTMKTLHGCCLLAQRLINVTLNVSNNQSVMHFVAEELLEKKSRRVMERLLQECLSASKLESNIIEEGSFFCSSSFGEGDFYFILTSTKLFYCRGKAANEVDLDSLNLLDIYLYQDSLSHLGYTFSFGFSTKRSSFYVRCSNSSECSSWTQAIIHAQRNLGSSSERNLYQSLSFNEASNKCVIWVPNEFSSKCGICSSGFSVFNRRHHCRNCGYLFCADCSNNKWLINHLDPIDSVRVCSNCFCNLKEKHSERFQNLNILYGNVNSAMKERVARREARTSLRNKKK